jgi:outer membrane protein OmpA-like peptidoglycan-associated protein
VRERNAIAACVLLACASDSSRPTEAERADPLWTATATQPSVARADAPALVLPTGRVLVAGGATSSGATSSVEVFDPSTETWFSGPVLPQPQAQPVLELWEGLAACVGGPRADALNAVGNAWSPLGAPLAAVNAAAGVTLADGRVVIIGSATQLLGSDGGFSPLLPPTAAHVGHTATLLGNGQVEVIGGPSAVAESLDVTANAWTPRAGPTVEGHTASLLLSGDLLLVGGTLPDGGVAGAERFNPLTGARTAVAGLRVPRASHGAAALPGGDVVITGGAGPNAARSAERYIFALDRFVASGCLDTPRARHAAVVLADGGVVLVGGVGLDGGYLARSERLDFTVGLLAPGQPCSQDCECGTGFCASNVCCDSACQGACLACSVATGGAVDGTCSLAGPSHVCRPAVGLCDADERCTGNDAGCPPDVLGDAGAICRSVAGACDVAEKCSGLSTQCPADGFVDAGAACRAAQGVCDVAEACTGASAACPADGFVDAGSVCRAAAAGGCDVAEVCNGLGPVCPIDGYADAGVVCRPASGGCDLPEACDGVTAVCPMDGVAFPGTVCRMVAGPCDVAEICTGTKACPADAVLDGGVMCRPASGACDVADVCDGVHVTCVDALVDAGTVCRASAGGCDLADLCDGVHIDCPDAIAAMGTVCRVGDAGCDLDAVCDGVVTTCPPSGIADAGVVCRAASDDCDVAEVCDGVQALCPLDLVVDAGVVCRAALGPCDDDELCDGQKKSCPVDTGPIPGARPCRPADGGCDVAEICNGLTVDCPLDGFKEAGAMCQAPGCSVAVMCTGNSAACPQEACVTPDAGNNGPGRYVGWSCACGEAGGAPWLLIALLLARPVMVSRAKRSRTIRRCTKALGAHALGTSLCRTNSGSMGSWRLRDAQHPSTRLRSTQGERVLVMLVLLTAFSARADPPVVSDFAVRANASLLRDVLASQVGLELGASFSLTPRFDLAAAASIGRLVGGRLGVTWHLRDDGEWVRPFFQARALLHGAQTGVAGGAGAWGGVLVPLGPGRIQAGALFEAYVGPKNYVPYDAFLTVGYELDLYRRIDRVGQRTGAPESEPQAPAATNAAEPAPPVATPEAATPAPEPEPGSAPAPEPAGAPEGTRVVTRVNLSRDVITFEERKAGWDAQGETTVRRVAEVLKRYPNLKKVEIGGHADDGDSDAECLKISQRRAEAVLHALVAAGVEAGRLVAKPYGNSRTKVPSKGPARKRIVNRRVDFTVLE